MGLLKTAGKVAVASSVHGRVQRRQQQRWAAQDATAAAAPAHPPTAPPAPAATAVEAADPRASHLQALTGLLSAGFVTPEEFAAISGRIAGS